ncbi:MAG: hypothetical protein PHH06_03225 [Candidatus Gracilibacteria bacterium]|nr:hypothetical protein [Candidatus Gracilibacteria bacterium]
MNLFKKIIATIALSTMVVVSTAPSVGAYSTAALEAANTLASQGIINDNSANPAGYNLDQNVLRQEIAAVTMGVAGLTKKTTCDNLFTDVSATTPNTWACYVVETLRVNNMIAANAKFNPEANITKAEALGMVVKAAFGADYNYDSTLSTSWQEQLVAFASENGIVSAFTDYNTPATRGWVFEAATASMDAAVMAGEDDDLLSGLLDGLDDMDDDTTDTNGGTTVVVPTGSSMSVELSPTTSSAKSIPNSGTVTFGSFDFTAGNQDTTLESIRVVRTGLGDRADFDRVWMEKDGVRVSGRQTVGSDESVYITFSPAFVIRAGETETLDLVATLDGDTGSQHSFSIVSASDITASASIAGNFPVSTSTMTTANYTVVPVAYATSGSPSTYRAGDTNVELAQFKLTNNAGNDKSVTFKSITLRNDGDGDMDTNLSNLAIYSNNVKISSDYSFDGKNVTFTVNSLVDFGRTETFYVRADVDSVDSTDGDTYKFTLRYTDDLIVDETATGFRASITKSGTAISYKVTGGDIILSKATTSSSQTVAPGTNDVVLLDAVLKVNQPITVEDLTVTHTSMNLFNYFSSIKLMIGNSVVSTYTPSSATGTTFDLEGTATINGDTTLKILANVKTNAPNLSSFALNSIDMGDFAIVEYAANGNSVDTNQKVGSASAVTTTIGSATLVMTRNDGISNQDVTVGSSNQTLMSFSMRANDVSPVTVTKLTFAPASVSGSGVTAANVTNVKLLVNGSVVSTKNMSSGNADFNDINIVIPKNDAVQVSVVADFSTAINVNEEFQLELTNVEARDSNSITLVTSGTGDAVTEPSNGVLYTFKGAGTATVALNSSTPNASILTPSTSEVELARYTLGAQNDALKLTDLYLYNTGSADLSSSLKTISLYDTAGNKLAGGSVLGTGTVQFALGSTSSFVIPKNTSNSVVVVRAAFNDVTAAAQTNKTIRLAVGTLAGISTVSGTTDGVRLVSEATGDTVTSVSGEETAIAKSHLLVRSKPTLAVSAAATLTTHTFTVTADANNRITLSGATIDLQNPSSSTGAFILYKDQEISGNSIATGIIAAGSNELTLTGLDTEISAGTTKTFILKLSGGMLSGNAANAKRIMTVQDVSYVDMMNTGGNVTISSVSSYSNVGLPTAESTFTY